MTAPRMARNEIGRRTRQRLRLIAVRRMAAIFEDHDFSLRCALANALDLREGAVLVVGALYREYRACDRRQQCFDRPRAKARIEPDVVPAEESRVDVVVIAREFRPDVRRPVRLARVLDAVDREVLDDDVRRDRYHAGDAGAKRRGVDQRDRRAVAVTEEPWRIALAGDAEAIEELRQKLLRLTMHEIDVPALVGTAWRRSSVAGAREHEAAVAAGVAQPLRIVLPHRERAQSLVQENDERRIDALARKPAMLDAHPAPIERDVDELDVRCVRRHAHD